MNYVIVSTSLSSNSRGKLLAQHMHELLSQKGHNVTIIDAADYDLPICDGKQCSENPDVQKIMPMIEAADGILFTVPIYNYNVAAASKNFLELTGTAWSQKVVGIMAAAGGDLSYLAVMPIMTSLMIDYRCIMVPRYVYATGAAFTDDALTDEKILERMQTLADEFEHLSTKLA